MAQTNTQYEITKLELLDTVAGRITDPQEQSTVLIHRQHIYDRSSAIRLLPTMATEINTFSITELGKICRSPHQEYEDGRCRIAFKNKVGFSIQINQLSLTRFLNRNS